MAKLLRAVVSLSAGLALATSGLAKTLEVAPGVIEVAPGPGAGERLQAALIEAQPGDIIHLAAGRYEAPDSLSLDVANVVVRGEGPDRTILAFDGQKAGSDGLLITSNHVVIEDLAVENARGNGIKSKGVDDITFRRVRVEWTGGPKETNGAYGVYPVASSHVLIDGVEVKGASDAGIYVGQSRFVIIENSKAAFNVAGIEIENCYNADVHDNLATHNAGGILVFDLPGLPQMGGHSVRVYHNAVLTNDTPNFAPRGNIVANVPTGTGVMVMANRDVHVFDNQIDGNGSAAVLLAAYLNAFSDASYNPLPRDVFVHDNHIGKNGFAPAFEGGGLLAKAFGGAVPPVLWDGVTAYVPPGGTRVSMALHLVVQDGPILSLDLGEQGTPLTKANPKLIPHLEGAALPEPAPVTLDGQAGKAP